MNTVVVVGAGASGMMAAVTASRQGAKVLLLEHGDLPGRKILATGNGKCNYTNEYMESDCFRGDRGGLVQAVLEQFHQKDSIAFFQELGVLPARKNGYVYPVSGQAQTIQEAFLTEIGEGNIQLQTGVEVTDIRREKNEFQIRLAEEQSKTKEGGIRSYRNLKGDRVILACGSKAASHFGSDGSGYVLAEKLGHNIVPVVPALVQLRSEGCFLKEWAGVRVWARVRLLINGKEVCADTGEVQLTDYGISGIPVFQVSRYGAYGLLKKKQVQAELCFLPDYSKEQVTALLQERKKRHPARSCSQLLAGMLHGRLIPVVLELAGIEKSEKRSGLWSAQSEGGKKKKEKRAAAFASLRQGEQHGRLAAELSDADLNRLTDVLTGLMIPITGVNSFDQAQVCAGGVDTAQVTEHMESRLVKGLYFAGEILDVDGMCGGYNLQWAWSTGWIAGMYAASEKPGSAQSRGHVLPPVRK